jgi:hypothetical protein
MLFYWLDIPMIKRGLLKTHGEPDGENQDTLQYKKKTLVVLLNMLLFLMFYDNI